MRPLGRQDFCEGLLTQVTRRLLWGGLLSLQLACTTVHSVHLTNLSVPREQGREISASVSKLVFLGFSFSSEYVFEARERLYRLCPEGVVTGVLSVFESTNAVLLSVETVRVRGYCVPAPED